jgi:hypothetical protein
MTASPVGSPDSVGRRRVSPYQGLVPYSSADADYFFGRNTWRDTVIDNLLAYRLTLFYGASGVGKSSVLSAGVVRRLRGASNDNLATRGTPEHVIVAYGSSKEDDDGAAEGSWKEEDPVTALKESIRASIEELSPELAREPPSGSLPDVLAAWSDRVGGPLLIVLDQFEEYFLYHSHDEGEQGFAAELSNALSRRLVRANFLISIREDALAKLDRFEGRVPGLMDNLLRIDHLDHDAAREAIEGPIE